MIGNIIKRHTYTCVMRHRGPTPDLREVLALAALSIFGCGLAFGQSDFLFATLFAAAGALTIIEALRRLG